jgi:hypothetical protein
MVERSREYQHCEVDAPRCRDDPCKRDVHNLQRAPTQLSLPPAATRSQPERVRRVLTTRRELQEAKLSVRTLDKRLPRPRSFVHAHPKNLVFPQKETIGDSIAQALFGVRCQLRSCCTVQKWIKSPFRLRAKLEGSIMKIKLLAIIVTMGCMLSVPVSAFALAWNDTETREYEQWLDGSPYDSGTHTYWNYSASNSSRPFHQKRAAVHPR